VLSSLAVRHATTLLFIVVVFLIWIYTQAVILLYGAEFTAAFARLRQGRLDEAPAAPSRRARCPVEQRSG